MIAAAVVADPGLPGELRPGQRPSQVDLVGLVPHGERHVDERPGVGVGGGVVDEDVAGPVALDAGVDDRLAVLGPARCGPEARRRWDRARAAASSSASGLRAVMRTLPPDSANALAIPFPMPFDPPVTMAALPSSRRSIPHPFGSTRPTRSRCLPSLAGTLIEARGSDHRRRHDRHTVTTTLNLRSKVEAVADRVGRQRPVKVGVRFSTNARAASR